MLHLRPMHRASSTTEQYKEKEALAEPRGLEQEMGRGQSSFTTHACKAHPTLFANAEHPNRSYSCACKYRSNLPLEARIRTCPLISPLPTTPTTKQQLTIPSLRKPSQHNPIAPDSRSTHSSTAHPSAPAYSDCRPPPPSPSQSHTARRPGSRPCSGRCRPPCRRRSARRRGLWL